MREYHNIEHFIVTRGKITGPCAGILKGLKEG
jgi:hypothetical protein